MVWYHKGNVKDCKFFNENGYLIIDLELTDNEISPVINDMYTSLNNENTKFHADHFQYTESKRIFDSLRKIKKKNR